jgi:hydroxymethylbilane synthase
MSDDNRTLKLGTRGSLLALAQSRLIAAALRSAHPNLDIELIRVETRGDRDRRTALSDVRDTRFFSAELETALLDHEVDFCVHSVKDLDTGRPDGIVCAAIPAREDPRDVIVFRGDILDRLKNGQLIRIGSSSRRRQSNVEPFLHQGLPQFESPPQLTFLPLRGPVDDRLRRINMDPTDGDALDGVVLALAGLARLSRDEAGRDAIASLLDDVRLMVLPLSACPTAPGQGALAIECRRDDTQTRALLATLHDEQTATLVDSEQKLIDDVPEAQRPAVGVTAVLQHALGPLIYTRGPEADSDRLVWKHPPHPDHARPWDGWRASEPTRIQSPPVEFHPRDGDAVFVAHWHAVTGSTGLDGGVRVWVSGVTSWRKLAARGIWVEGCADNLGFADIKPTLECEALNLPPLSEWTVLTHVGAEPGWQSSGVGEVLATYSAGWPDDVGTEPNELARVRESVRSATHFFWGSVGQYTAIKHWLPTGAHHACGAGKTADALREAGVESPDLFPSKKEWQSWLR